MDVVKDLTCPICLEFYSHPIILPCSHVMCRQPCAEHLFEGNFIRCPVCRDNCYVSGGISSLPRVITIESIIEKIRADRKKRIAAGNTQLKDGSHDDLLTPESWLHKTSVDDMFSDIASAESVSPDIFNERSTNPVASDSSSTTILPIGASASGTLFFHQPHSVTRNLPGIDIHRNSSRSVALGDRVERRHREISNSSHFTAISPPLTSPPLLSYRTSQPHSSNLISQPYSLPLSSQPFPHPISSQSISSHLSSQPILSSHLACQPLSSDLASRPLRSHLDFQPLSSDLAFRPLRSHLDVQPLSTPLTSQSRLSESTLESRNVPNLSENEAIPNRFENQVVPNSQSVVPNILFPGTSSQHHQIDIPRLDLQSHLLSNSLVCQKSPREECQISSDCRDFQCAVDVPLKTSDNRIRISPDSRNFHPTDGDITRVSDFVSTTDSARVVQHIDGLDDVPREGISSRPISNAFRPFINTTNDINNNNNNYNNDNDNNSTRIPQSVTYTNLKLCHEQSIANLQACSNSILDLQNEYLTLTHNIQNQSTPRRENHQGSIASSADTNCPPVSNFCSVFQQSSSSSSSSSLSIHSLSTISAFNLEHRNTEVRHPSQIKVDETQAKRNSIVAMDTQMLLSTTEEQKGEENVADQPLPSSGMSTEEVVVHALDVYLPPPERILVDDLKMDLKRQLEKLCKAHCQLAQRMNSYRSQAVREQSVLEREKDDINKECDSLVAEIEDKRSHFLLHLEDEENYGKLNLSDVTVAMETLLESTHHLAQFVGQMLGSKPEVLLNTASNVFDRLSRAVHDCESCLHESATAFTGIDNTALFDVDDKIQGSIVSDLECLDTPTRPVIDTQRCARNTHTVALVLVPPPLSDVIDHYEVCYCSEEQKNLGIEERYYAKQMVDINVHDITGACFPIILLQNLCASTHYFFYICAVNRNGRSRMSDYVQCVTLADLDCVVPVPTIMKKISHGHSTSIQMVCPSLATVIAQQEVGHFLLQRCGEQGTYVWKGKELHRNNEDFLVSHLRPGTRHYFIVMAWNRRGECQLSSVSVFDI